MTRGCRDQPAVGHHVQHRLEVALLGPAHEADGVVLALVLVGGVVAAGTVGAGHLEGELLVVESRPG